MADNRAVQQGTELDRRESPRFVLLLRPAKVVTQSGEYLCILRDVATNGVRLKLFHPLPHERFMALELSNGDRYEVEKIWERDDQAGFHFVHQAELTHLLEERSRFRRRPVRLRLEIPAQLSAAGMTSAGILQDLSQQGGRIETTLALAIDQRVHLAARGLPPLDAKVRWRRGGQVGLVFEQTFKLDDLARRVAAMQPFDPAIPDEEDAVFAKLKSA